MPECAVHASLVRVDGRGVLIRGAPGTGKSRLALEFLLREHTLMADDLVLLTSRSGVLYGTAPTEWNGQVALRGVGMLSVAEHFGSAAIHRGEQRIDWIVDLGAPAAHATPEHDTVEIQGIVCPRLQMAAHSRDVELITLCCHLGSTSLHRWKDLDVHPHHA